MRLYAMVLVLGLAAAGGAQAQAIGFKGVALGAKKDELLAKFPTLMCKKLAGPQRSLGEEQCANLDRRCFRVECVASRRSLATYAEQPISGLTFSVVAGRFERFSLVVKSDSYEVIRNSLKTAFGAGVEEGRHAPVHGGTAPSSRTWVYSQSGSSLTLYEHNGGPDEGAVVGSTAAFSDYERKTREGDAQKGSKDI